MPPPPPSNPAKIPLLATTLPLLALLALALSLHLLRAHRRRRRAHTLSSTSQIFVTTQISQSASAPSAPSAPSPPARALLRSPTQHAAAMMAEGPGYTRATYTMAVMGQAATGEEWRDIAQGVVLGEEAAGFVKWAGVCGREWGGGRGGGA